MIGSSTSMTPQKAGAQSPLSKSLLAPEDRKTPFPGPGLEKPQMAPQGKPQQAPNYSGQSTIRPPQYIDINTTEDSVNSVMAKGFQEADQRYQLKQTDRAGLSRGRGNQYMAEQASVQAMTKAAADAAGVRAEDDKNNAKMRSDYEKSMELEAQNLAMVQHTTSQANWSQQFAQQQNSQRLMEALMNERLQKIPAPRRSSSVSTGGGRVVHLN